jgi:hypothetical protein
LVAALTALFAKLVKEPNPKGIFTIYLLYVL